MKPFHPLQADQNQVQELGKMASITKKKLRQMLFVQKLHVEVKQT